MPTRKKTSAAFSENPPLFKLQVELDAPYCYVSKIWIFQDNSLLFSPSDNTQNGRYRNYLVPSGHIMIRVEVDGQIADNDIMISGETVCYVGKRPITNEGIILGLPKLYSSIPLDNKDFASSYAYYIDAAEEISKEPTCHLPESKNNSGLFLFIRFPNREIFHNRFQRQTEWENYSILDSQQVTIIRFSKNSYKTRHDTEFGCLGLTVYLKPGGYFLKYSGANPRIVPIYVYEHWFTHVFLMVTDRPLWGTLRMSINNRIAFDASDRYLSYIDICLSKLQNNDLKIDDELLREIAYGKWESPMMGLLGAYIYLSGDEDKDDNLFKTIVSNIRRQILRNSEQSPDIWALNLLSYEHFSEVLDNTATTLVQGTPILRVAFDTIRRMSVRFAWVIGRDSINDYIAENQRFDSPFNTFTPIQVPKNPKKDIQGPVGRAIEFYTGWTHKIVAPISTFLRETNMGSALRDANDPPYPSFDGNEQLVSHVPPQKKSLYDRLLKNPKATGRIGTGIVKCLLDNPQVTVREVAEQLHVPLNTILRKKDELNL